MRVTHRGNDLLQHGFEIGQNFVVPETQNPIATIFKKFCATQIRFDLTGMVATINFHNEPAFAKQLQSLSKQMGVPQTAQEEFVEAVVTCASGKRYGVSWAAEPTYHELTRNFSPREVSLMLRVEQRKSTHRAQAPVSGRS